MSKTTLTLTAGRPSAGRSAATLASLADTGAGRKRVNFDVSEQQHRKLKMHAAREGVSITDLLKAYVDQLPD